MNLKYFFGMVFGFLCAMVLSVNCPVSAQHIRLVIGEYECKSTADCEDGICDIDTHTCRTFPSCPELPECGALHEVDGKCVECISNADCTDSNKPWCNIGTFACQTCPGDKPFWNGSECEACPAGTTLESGVCACPSDKPYRLAACIGCEGNKIFVSERNSCECPSGLPNWNASAKVCSPACTNGYLWSGTSCVECLTNNDCDDALKPVCNASNSCESCPTNTPYWNYATKRCESCPTSTPYWNTSTKKCTECPTSTPVWNTSTKKCEACPTSTPVWNTSTKKCERCPISTPVWNASTKKCEVCPASTPSWNASTKKCETCPTSKPYWNTASRRCENCPSTAAFWDTTQKKCVSCAGTSIDDKCYICDSSQGESFDKNNMVCSINLNAKNFQYGGGWGGSVASTGSRPYTYTIVVYTYYVDDWLKMFYRPAKGGETVTTICNWTRTAQTITRTLTKGDSAYFEIQNGGKNETGFKGTIHLRRSPKILNRG